MSQAACYGITFSTSKSMMPCRGLVALVLILYGISVTPPVAAADQSAAAVKVSTEWLHSIDKGQYAAAWKATAPLFKSKQGGQKDFENKLSSILKPLGKFVSRKVFSKRTVENLTGAPNGKYIEVIYASKYSKKKVAEMVTPMLCEDGKWRVSGYFIK